MYVPVQLKSKIAEGGDINASLFDNVSLSFGGHSYRPKLTCGSQLASFYEQLVQDLREQSYKFQKSVCVF